MDLTAASVVLDSVNPLGHRLTTFKLVLPRIILAELNTHRILAKNASSSRAIPITRMLKNIQENPFVPTAFGANQKGMQAGELLDETDQKLAEECWLRAMRQAVYETNILKGIEVHKSWANRLVEPWMFTHVVLSGTDWANFFYLRLSKMAQPEFKKLAECIGHALIDSQPKYLDWGHWHLPFITPGEWAEYGTEDLKKMSAARSARVSYEKHDGTMPLFTEDVGLHDKLLFDLHMSPFDHPAMAVNRDRRDTAQYRGWMPMRKMIAGETCKSFDLGKALGRESYIIDDNG